QEIGLICGVAVGAGENHPIGAAGREHIHRSRPEVGKQTAPGPTVSRRLAVQHTLVDRLMVAGLDSPIELRVALRLEGRIAVKGGGEIQQSASAHQGTEAWQRRGHIYQVEKGLPDHQVPGPAAVLAGHEMRHVDRLGFYRAVLPYPPKMQLSLGVLVHLKPPLVSGDHRNHPTATAGFQRLRPDHPRRRSLCRARAMAQGTAARGRANGSSPAPGCAQSIISRRYAGASSSATRWQRRSRTSMWRLPPPAWIPPAGSTTIRRSPPITGVRRGCRSTLP